jgi:hypothetical protein
MNRYQHQRIADTRKAMQWCLDHCEDGVVTSGGDLTAAWHADRGWQEQEAGQAARLR